MKGFTLACDTVLACYYLLSEVEESSLIAYIARAASSYVDLKSLNELSVKKIVLSFICIFFKIVGWIQYTICQGYLFESFEIIKC